MEKIDLDLLADIASEVEGEDPIPWDKLALGKTEAMKMIGASVLEQFDKEEYTTEDKLIMLSTITKLIVENMLLNIKLLAIKENMDEKL
jgi:hypothetical protein